MVGTSTSTNTSTSTSTYTYLRTHTYSSLSLIVYRIISRATGSCFLYSSVAYTCVLCAVCCVVPYLPSDVQRTPKYEYITLHIYYLRIRIGIGIGIVY